MKTPECTQRYLHLQGAGASPSDSLVPLQSLFSSFILRSVGPAALITDFDEIKRDIRNSGFHEIFISFHLGSFAASRPSEIEMSQLRFEALPCEITIITMAQHDAIIRDNDNLLRRAFLAAAVAENRTLFVMVGSEYFGGPPGVSTPIIWGISEMRSLLNLPDVYSGAFYACKLAQTRGRRPGRVIFNILSIKDTFFHGPPLVLTQGAETKYTGPPYDMSLPDARLQDFVSSGFFSQVMQGFLLSFASLVP